MRKIMVREYKYGIRPHLVDKGEAVFHQFGSDFMKNENGSGSFTTAVIEWPDGTVENIPAQNIRFLDNDN